MSATELIEQLKALPAGEREAFARLFHELAGAASPETESSEPALGLNSGDGPDFGARLKRIYGDKVAADSDALISSARGGEQ